MSSRHRNNELAPVARADVRAHAHNERHRVNSELHQVADAVRRGTAPIDIDEPGPAWKPVHHHDPERGRAKVRRGRLRHWKTKDWKRRTAGRRARAAAWDLLA
jgi:hypothetical protein